MIEALVQLDPSGWMARFALVFARIFGMVFFLPIFGSEVLPVRMRLGLAIALALVMLPIVAPGIVLPHGVAGWVAVGARELAIGLGFGIAAKAIFAGIEAAAGLIAGQSGFALANMVDPFSGDQALAPALFQNMIVIALFLAADLHHLIIQAMRASYDLVPTAAALPDLSAFASIASNAGTRLFTIAATLAGPALIVTFSIDLLLAMVGRAMTQVPILLVGYPVKMAGGLLAMGLLATTTGAMLGWIGRTVVSDGMLIVNALAGGG